MQKNRKAFCSNPNLNVGEAYLAEASFCLKSTRAAFGLQTKEALHTTADTEGFQFLQRLSN